MTARSPCWPTVTGKAAERAQRRGCGGRRGGLVQRPGLRILGDYEGYRAEPELPTYLYRLDPDGRLDAAAELRSPNGLAFSPDESVLYVVESLAVPHRRIVAYDVRDGSLGEQRPFIDCGDGIRTGCGSMRTATCGAAGAAARD